MNEQEPAVPTPGGGGFLRVRLDIAYDGGPFSGWAVQPGRLTVQGVLEESLALLLRRPVRLTVAGRTDAGVHARGQVAHLDVTPGEWEGLRRGHDVDPAVSLRRRLNGALGRVLGALHGTVEVAAASKAPDGFDARFSALWRRYSYRIADASVRRDPLQRAVTLWHNHELDEALMNQAARPLLGLADFRAFAKPREGSTTVRTLQRLDFERGPDGVINVNVQADAFCHNMVRALAGAAMRVGDGREHPGWMHQRLVAGIRDAKSVLAAPHPLILEEVHYPDDSLMLERAELTRARRSVPEAADKGC
ncbi:tRNA pseudouridine38-40 synthase [Arthrobacter silviterrae]|uniref:tRNA pseudouridine synthase A n=1 Tax=Arthrobacter silviterrae TaxID=2026658 RepID=A0ABX0DDL2_9MICC|nr:MULTISPECIES: tRNA pseudouridine synthase A [Arthrobacter]MCU6479307.1 tRNA pseudouridine synthase A [Arthrobacter sp. A2-55]MDQ0277591.1 tRNA pseudouridine38-40 synthase [Arthrobacter silviterrae]NGN85018.1 tRNA pseudouridine(38-40) synthase TruA [Arthrobacter silviterrae]